jgi:hypothetical protein
VNVLRKIWAGWKRFGQFMGDVVGRLVLTVFYFTIFLPFGAGMRLLGDRLDIKRQDKPAWRKRKTVDLTLDDARRLS